MGIVGLANPHSVRVSVGYPRRDGTAPLPDARLPRPRLRRRRCRSGRPARQSVQAWGWWSSIAVRGRNTLDSLLSTVACLSFLWDGLRGAPTLAGPLLYPTPSLYGIVFVLSTKLC